MAGGAKQRLRSGCAAVVIGVTGLVAPADIGLGLCDAAGQQLTVQPPDQELAQQGLGDGNRVAGIEILESLAMVSPRCWNQRLMQMGCHDYTTESKQEQDQ